MVFYVLLSILQINQGIVLSLFYSEGYRKQMTKTNIILDISSPAKGNDPPPIKQMTKTNYSEHIFANQGFRSASHLPHPWWC